MYNPNTFEQTEINSRFTIGIFRIHVVSIGIDTTIIKLNQLDYCSGFEYKLIN